MRLGGIVLCGGRSTRMGTPKAWLPIGDEVMLQRVVRQLPAPVVVVAAEGQPLPAIDAPIVRDTRPDRGPLEGLHSGLITQTTDVVFVCAGDLPFLTRDLIQHLISQLGDADACVPILDGRMQPLAAVYRTSIRPIVASLLEQDRRAMKDLLASIPVALFEASAYRNELRNINTPEDYSTYCS